MTGCDMILQCKEHRLFAGTAFVELASAADVGEEPASIRLFARKFQALFDCLLFKVEGAGFRAWGLREFGFRIQGLSFHSFCTKKKPLECALLKTNVLETYSPKGFM